LTDSWDGKSFSPKNPRLWNWLRPVMVPSSVLETQVEPMSILDATEAFYFALMECTFIISLVHVQSLDLHISSRMPWHIPLSLLEDPFQSITRLRLQGGSLASAPYFWFKKIEYLSMKHIYFFQGFTLKCSPRNFCLWPDSDSLPVVPSGWDFQLLNHFTLSWEHDRQAELDLSTALSNHQTLLRRCPATLKSLALIGISLHPHNRDPTLGLFLH
jgi:hypothetical protein